LIAAVLLSAANPQDAYEIWTCWL